MEKKRRLRTHRDQPAPNKPGEPYQKSRPHTRTNSPVTQPAPPDPSNLSSSRRKSTSYASKVEASSLSYFDAHLPEPSPDEHRVLYPPATSPSRSSLTSSPYYLNAGTFPSPDPRNLSPSRASLPMPTPPFDHFQHMAPGSQSTLDSLFPTSPGHHESQGYSNELPRELRAQHSTSQAIPVDGSQLGTQFNDLYGPDHSYWNEYYSRRSKLPAYPHSSTSLPPNLPASQLVHRPEQVVTTYSLPPTLHGLDTPPAGNSSESYCYPDDEDCTASTSAQSVYFPADHSSDAGPLTTIPYYS